MKKDDDDKARHGEAEDPRKERHADDSGMPSRRRDKDSPQSDRRDAEEASRAELRDDTSVETETDSIQNLPLDFPRFLDGHIASSRSVGAQPVTSPDNVSVSGSMNEGNRDNPEGRQVVATAYVVEDAVEDAERIRVLERTVRDYQERENALAYADVVYKESRFHQTKRLAQVCCAVIAVFLVLVAAVYAVNEVTGANRIRDWPTNSKTADSPFQNTTAAPTISPQVADAVLRAWEQIGSDIQGEAPIDLFGASTAISANGSRVVVGAHANDGMGDKSGHVRVFDWSDELNDWFQIGADIEGENAGDESGRSVAMSADGTRIVVGARLNSGSGNQSGHVRAFDWDRGPGDWVQTGDDLDGENPKDEFGTSVSISADGRRIAGGSEENSDAGYRAGHVRVSGWHDASANWVQVGADIDGSDAGDRSGWDVALSADGARLAVACPHNGNNGYKAGQGRVFHYDDTAGWVLLGDAVDGEANGGEMRKVAMSADGNRVAFGSPFIYGRTGHVRVFGWDDFTGRWLQVGRNINGENEGDEFGNFLSLSGDGNRLAVGAAKNNNNGKNWAGNARVFDYDADLLDWVQVGPTLNGTSVNGKFGVAVRLSSDGQRVVVGAPEGAGGYGCARVFALREV